MIYLLFFLVVAMVVRLLEASVPKSISLAVVALMLGLFAAVRGPDVANDYYVYQSWYAGVGLEDSMMEHAFSFEWIFYKCMKVSSNLGLSFTVFLGLIAIPVIYIKLYAIRNYASNGTGFMFVVILYGGTFYLLHELSQIRAGIAISIIMLATHQLIAGRVHYFYLMVLMASGFHMEALLAIPMPLLLLGQPKKWNYVLIGITLILLLLRMAGKSFMQPIANLISFWDPKLSFYASNAFTDNAVSANSFSVSAVILLVLGVNLLLSDAVTRLTEGRHSVALVFASRCLLVSLWPIFLLPEIQEVALRTHEFLAVNILFIVALLFSRKGFWIPKLLILGWGGANVFINIFRAESLVRPYAINWF